MPSGNSLGSWDGALRDMRQKSAPGQGQKNAAISGRITW
jgi:hypothetical protein